MTGGNTECKWKEFAKGRTVEAGGKKAGKKSGEEKRGIEIRPELEKIGRRKKMGRFGLKKFDGGKNSAVERGGGHLNGLGKMGNLRRYAVENL
jgi:hypothetical protein